MKKLRKFLVVSVMVLSVVAMSGLVIAPTAKAAASAGDLIKMDGLSSVYYLGSDSKRYVFPNEATFFSWYSDFSGVVTVSATELQSYAIGGNVTMRPGTKLVKITTDPSVYAVTPNGVLRKIQSESQAATLYGTNWNQKVVDVPDAFFTNYTIGSALPTGEFAVGSLVKNNGATEIFYFDGTNYRKIANETAFNANRFNMANVMTASVTVAGTGAEITGAETALMNTAQNGGTGPVVTGSGLMVSLSATTPASVNVPINVAVEFLKLNLTAANDGAVNVNSIKLTAYDLGNPVNIDDVTFYDEGVKVGTAKNITSDGVATFNFATPVVVNAGTTKTLTVKATLAATGNYILGVAAAADILSSAATVSGSFPVKGNSMAGVTSATVGTVGMTNVGTNDTNNNFGEDNVMLASFDLTANNEDILISSLKLKNGGTNDDAILSNPKIYIDGNEVAATATYADSYLTFNMNNYMITKSDIVAVEIKGDVGTTNVIDTIELYIKDKADFAFVGKTYGFSASLVNADFLTFDTNTEGIIVTLTAGDFTIDMDKSSTGTPAKDVKAGDNDVVLATLIFKSNSENATIEQIVGTSTTQFEIQGTGLIAGEIENVEMVDASTGGVYDVTATYNGDAVVGWDLSMTDEISLVKGVAKKFYLRADMSDTTSYEIDNNDTLKVVLDKEAMTVTGDVSDASITDITPGEVSSAITTVKDASLTWEPVSLTNVTVVGGATDVVMYQASVKAGTADGINLQSVKLSTVNGTEPAFADTNITKLDLYLNGKLLKSVSGDIAEGGAASSTITFNSLDTAYYTVAAGATVDLVVKGTFASSLTETGNAFALQVASGSDITSRSVTGNKLVTETGTITGGSRNLTLQSVGTLKVDLVTTDSKADQDSWILAGSESAADRYLGELKFTTENEAVKVTALTLNATSSATASNDDLKEVKLYQMVSGTPTVVATSIVDAGGDVTFDPLNIVFPADQVTSLFISVVTKGMNVDSDPSATADYNASIAYNIASVTANGDNSGTAITMTQDANAGATADNEYSTASIATKVAYVVGTKLNTIVNALSDGTLGGGANKVIGKYTLVFDNGNNRNAANEALKAILSTTTVTITKSTNVDISDAVMYIEGASSNTASATGDTGTTTTVLSWAPADLANLADGGKLDGSVTLVIAATVTPSADAGEFVQTSLADLSGTGSNDDITYIGDGETASAALTNMYVPVSYVNGGTLSE